MWLLALAGTFLAMLLLVGLVAISSDGEPDTPHELADWTRENYPDYSNLSDSEISDMSLEICDGLQAGTQPEDMITTVEPGAQKKARDFIEFSTKIYCPAMLP